MYIYMYTRIYIHVYIHMYMYIHTCMHVYMHICMYVYQKHRFWSFTTNGLRTNQWRFEVVYMYAGSGLKYCLYVFLFLLLCHHTVSTPSMSGSHTGGVQ